MTQQKQYELWRAEQQKLKEEELKDDCTFKPQTTEFDQSICKSTLQTVLHSLNKSSKLLELSHLKDDKVNRKNSEDIEVMSGPILIKNLKSKKEKQNASTERFNQNED